MLVSSCDGVGTKLKIAIFAHNHRTIGIDLVAMSVNDVLCSGAEPLFFLDYIATGKIETPVLKEVVKGIVAGCRQANCALVGGETAEMPGMYKAGEYDLAGFCVGVLDKNKILGRDRVKLGDAVIGLASSGIHSNGFSLVRKIFSPEELSARAQEFLAPTRIYVKPVLRVLEKFNAKGFKIKALAHITGGGFYDKAVRVVPSHTTMILYKNAWVRPDIFIEMQDRSKIDDKEMFRTFNMGIGMVLVVKDDVKMDVVRALARAGLKSFHHRRDGQRRRRRRRRIKEKGLLKYFLLFFRNTSSCSQTKLWKRGWVLSWLYKYKSMKILVIGSGGREHALVWKIAQSKLVSKIYCAPGNGGIAGLAECVDIKADDIPGFWILPEKKRST